MIGRTREAGADAGFDSDHFGVDIDDSKQLMRLFTFARPNARC